MPRGARIWLLYMAGSAVGFEENRIQVHQVLGVATPPDGVERDARSPRLGVLGLQPEPPCTSGPMST